jgi:Uma2 family endonuclease
LVFAKQLTLPGVSNMEIAEEIPKTALDVFRLLPEGTLCEVIDNVLYMSPAPKYDHQKLLFFLARNIANFADTAGKGEVMVCPFDVYLEGLQSAVQPDILFVSNENRAILKEDGYVHGAPDLIVEVLRAIVKETWL